MWPYWILFILPALAASTERVIARQGSQLSPSASRQKRLSPAWFGVVVGLILLVGYRFEVGGDWFNYLYYIEVTSDQSLSEALSQPDPGYQLLNWISTLIGWDIVGVNVLGAILFATGLAVFCTSLARPWLALTVSIPYLVIVVGMGYSRQGIALALTMIGLVALQRQSLYKFLGWVLLAATFHKTAVLLMPIGLLMTSERRFLRFVWVAIATVGGYFLLLAESMEVLYVGYVEQEYQSEGALVRLLMNAIPALLLLVFWKRFRPLPGISRLWLWFAWGSLALLLVLYVSPSSTAVDRLALYMLPLQLVVFSSFPDAITERHRSPRPWVASVLMYYGLVLFVWLNYAGHSEFWLPYRSYLVEVLS